VRDVWFSIRHLTRAVAIVAIIGTSRAATAAAQTPAPPVVSTTPVAAHTEAARLTTAPKLDDYLDGGSHPGHLVTGFKQRDPKDLAPATEDTEAYLAYDGASGRSVRFSRCGIIRP
jgi:hypothetical protein